MDYPRQDLATLAEFLSVVEREGIRGVALRAVREIRPRKLPKHAVEVGMQQWVELTAYKAGTVFVLMLQGAEGPEVEAELKQRGLTIRAGSDNIT